jgi:hypothetical protein
VQITDRAHVLPPRIPVILSLQPKVIMHSATNKKLLMRFES